MNPACDIKTKLNFLFDLHGVLKEHFKLFRPMLKSLRCCGHSVIIASGSMPEMLKSELEELGYKEGLHYDKAISVPEYLINLGVPFTFDERERPWTDDFTWWNSKSLICEEYKIDMMIDDTEKYQEHLFTNTVFTLLK